MSNVGEGILTVGGFLVGTYFGAPQLGLMLGSLAGKALFPTKLPGVSGPRLTDGRTTTAEIGVPLFEVFGTDVVPGTVIWLAPIRTETTTEEQGGKGGGGGQEVTTYTYYQSIAIGLCRADEPIGGVLRIWENGELMYDVRPQQEGESDADYARRESTAADYAQTFTLYTGGAEQEPDPTIQQHEGEDNTPGFSGLAYLVYPDRQLQDNQGRRHPNFKFEIAPAVGDPYWDSVILLLQAHTGELRERTGVPHTVTVSGNGAVLNDRVRFGVGAFRNFGGTGIFTNLNYVRATAAADVYEFPGAFTWEGWFNGDIYSAFNAMNFFSSEVNYPGSGYTQVATNGTGIVFTNSSAIGGISTPVTGIFTLDTWHHVAFVADPVLPSRNLRLYVDGIRVAASVGSALGEFGSGALSFDVGRAIAADNGNFNGWWDQIRVTKGVARYTGDSFNVPVAPFPAFGS